MSRVRVEGFTVSLDGYGAGPAQDLEHPLGIGGGALHKWLVATRSWRRMHGQDGGDDGIDEAFAARAHRGVGAWIMGRNMFGPIRGDWPNDEWKGWWGDTPPYHCPVFVLTRYPRESLAMDGGTVFHFVTGGIDEALARAKDAAGERDVRIGGGASTVRQYLQSGGIDTLHIAISPVLLGQGEALFAGLDLPALGYRIKEHTQGEHAMHLELDRA